MPLGDAGEITPGTIAAVTSLGSAASSHVSRSAARSSESARPNGASVVPWISCLNAYASIATWPARHTARPAATTPPRTRGRAREIHATSPPIATAMSSQPVGAIRLQPNTSSSSARRRWSTTRVQNAPAGAAKKLPELTAGGATPVIRNQSVSTPEPMTQLRSRPRCSSPATASTAIGAHTTKM